jgi:hypothetical protein
MKTDREVIDPSTYTFRPDRKPSIPEKRGSSTFVAPPIDRRHGDVCENPFPIRKGPDAGVCVRRPLQ